jgi:hypothetical protein
VRPPWWRLAAGGIASGLWPIARDRRAAGFPSRTTDNTVAGSVGTYPAVGATATLGRTSTRSAVQAGSMPVSGWTDNLPSGGRPVGAPATGTTVRRSTADARTVVGAAPRPLVSVARTATVGPTDTADATTRPAGPMPRISLAQQGHDTPETPTVRRSADSPERRWRSAVAGRPLESPRPFPTSLRPLVARLAGSADRPSYTTGPATRAALAEAGALGATTGTVVHLARHPGDDPASIGVLAHELSHARQPVGRPRFLLSVPSGSADADERTARSVGTRTHTDAMALPALSPSALSTPVARVARAATGQTFSPPDNGTGGSTGAVRSGLTETAGVVSAGVVDQLPVGAVTQTVSAGTSTFGDIANGAAASTTPGGGTDIASTMDGATARNLLAALSAAAGQGATTVAPTGADATAPTTDQNQTGQPAAAGATSTSTGTGTASGAPAAGNQGTTGHVSPQDIDRIAEALEQRMMRQLERRGGRYAGVF